MVVVAHILFLTHGSRRIDRAKEANTHNDSFLTSAPVRGQNNLRNTHLNCLTPITPSCAPFVVYAPDAQKGRVCCFVDYVRTEFSDLLISYSTSLPYNMDEHRRNTCQIDRFATATHSLFTSQTLDRIVGLSADCLSRVTQ